MEVLHAVTIVIVTFAEVGASGYLDSLELRGWERDLPRREVGGEPLDGPRADHRDDCGHGRPCALVEPGMAEDDGRGGADFGGYGVYRLVHGCVGSCGAAFPEPVREVRLCWRVGRCWSVRGTRRLAGTKRRRRSPLLPRSG